MKIKESGNAKSTVIVYFLVAAVLGRSASIHLRIPATHIEIDVESRQEEVYSGD